MLFTSFWFPLFIAGVCALYYAVPKKTRWCVLLAASYGFYFTYSIPLSGFLIFTTGSVFLCAKAMDALGAREKARIAALPSPLGKEEKKANARRLRASKRVFLLLGLLSNLGILVFLKYANFLVEMVTKNPMTFAILALPIGLSFYTFQSIGYLLDVYYGRVKADQNIFRFALFVSFFPQIIQGPIGRYSDLSKTLYAGGGFCYPRFRHGILTILWGYFKKLLIADRLAAASAVFFAAGANFAGANVLIGILAYTFQLYCDFSGGIDIVRGVAELFGVTLAKNFERPFFATTVTDFWRRWHITLGAWLREYLFYPLCLSRAFVNLKKRLSRHSKFLGKTIPLCLATLILFFLIGIWHDASYSFVFYGLANGALISVGLLLEPLFVRWKAAWHIRETSLWFHLFRILRTFILLCLVRIVVNASSLSIGFSLVKNLFADFSLSAFLPGALLTTLRSVFGLSLMDLALLAFGLLVLLCVSLLQENHKSVCSVFLRLPVALRWVVLFLVVFCLVFFAANGTNLTGGFLYARF